MKLRQKTSNPRVGDKVWNQNSIDNQPNGYICQVIWDEREVIVKYYDNRSEVIGWDELDGNWTDKFGGTYILYAG